MAKGFADLAAMKQEGSGHTLNVAGWIPDEVAVKPGIEHARDALEVQVLAQLGALQAELLVQAPLGIAEPRNVEETIRLEEPLSLFFGPEMNEGQRRAVGLNVAALFGNSGDGLTAERAAKVPQENQEERALDEMIGESLTGLRSVRGQKRGIGLVGAKHGMITAMPGYDVKRIAPRELAQRRSMVTAPWLEDSRASVCR